MRTDVLFVFPFNAWIYQWAVRLTTILSAELGHVILPYLATGYGTTEIAYAIRESVILLLALLTIFKCA